jgi:hypothetical protein
MVEISNELIYEVLKNLQDRLGTLDGKMDEMHGELRAIRTHSMAVQQDVNRLDRIEWRLQIAEVTE